MLADPDQLPDMDEAAGLLADAIDAGAPMRIIGDYDVDGVCATYCLLESLKRLGAQVDADIPDRKQDGYGINNRLIEQAVRDGIEVIVTCDNGIGAHEAVRSAVDQGLSVIVTDHHEVGTEGLPQADAVIDPKRADSVFPEREICGAAVAWQTMRSLYRRADRDADELNELLPFVAMATVCDVVPMIGDRAHQKDRTCGALSSDRGLRSRKGQDIGLSYGFYPGTLHQRLRPHDFRARCLKPAV